MSIDFKLSASDAMFHPYFRAIHDAEYIEKIVDGFVRGIAKQLRMDIPNDVDGLVYSFYIGDKDSLSDAEMVIGDKVNIFDNDFEENIKTKDGVRSVMYDTLNNVKISKAT